MCLWAENKKLYRRKRRKNDTGRLLALGGGEMISDPAENLINAARNGNLDKVKIIAPLVSEYTLGNAIFYAAGKGYLEIVQFLAPLVSEHFRENAWKSAMWDDRLSVVEYLESLGVKL